MTQNPFDELDDYNNYDEVYRNTDEENQLDIESDFYETPEDEWEV